MVILNPLTPGAFCQKCVFWTFWWFSGWISANRALIWSKRHLQHNSLPCLPLASRFMTFGLQWATKAVETLLGNDSVRYLSICSILFASSVKSLIPQASQGRKGGNLSPQGEGGNVTKMLKNSILLQGV